MGSMETSDLHQTAVLWVASGLDDTGTPTLSEPIQIPFRLEVGKKQTGGSNSDTVHYDSIGYVDREIIIGSIIWVGCLKDKPTTPTTLKKVVDYSEIPDVKNRHVRRFVKLITYNDTLPQLG
jgi:hypothetical protein